MKKVFIQFTCFFLFIIFNVGVLSCNNEKQDVATTTTKSEKSEAVRIAYVEVDSLLSQYDFCKEYILILNKKSESIQRTIASKEQSLANAAANFQKRMQTGLITSEEQAKKENLALQKQQLELQSLQAKLSEEFATLQTKYNNALRDSLHLFLESYNKTHQYTMIVSKAGDNILYANPKLNITTDVINGLNKRYKNNKK